MYVARSREPAPAVSRAPEPATVVKRRPAPGLVVHPGPAIEVGPNPAAVTVRRPFGAYAGVPNPPVLRHIHPAAAGVEIVSAGDFRADVLIAARPAQVLIAACVPLVEIVLRDRTHNLKLRIGRVSLHHHAIALMDRFNAARCIDFRVTRARGHLN